MVGLALVGSATATLGCEVILDFDDYEVALETAGTAGAGNLNGSGMLRVRRNDGTHFWMDAREVTRGQYAGFLATPSSGSGGRCAWNEAYVDADCESSVPDGPGEGHPQVCVDWCDAQAYCQSVDKTLCAGEDWQQACSNGMEDQVPYSGSDATVCNVLATGLGSTSDVDAGETRDCVDAVGVRDLIGNAAEWVDDCTEQRGSPGEDLCAVRGGWFGAEGSDLTCEAFREHARQQRSDHVGFRCCQQIGS